MSAASPVRERRSGETGRRSAPAAPRKHTSRLTHPHKVRDAKRKLRHRLKVASAEARRLAEAERRRTQGV